MFARGRGGAGVRWLSFGEKTEHPEALRVDIRPVADMVADIRQLVFADEEFDGVECLVVIEHLHRSEASGALRELYRVLRPGGELIISTHDMEACARTLLAGNVSILVNIYSPHSEPAQRHRWGYTWETLHSLVAGAGFVDLERLPEADPHAMRARAKRPNA